MPKPVTAYADHYNWSGTSYTTFNTTDHPGGGFTESLSWLNDDADKIYIQKLDVYGAGRGKRFTYVQVGLPHDSAEYTQSGTFTNRADHRNMMLWWFDKWLRGQPGAWEARWSE